MNYVMSDIHGNLRRFESVLKQIALTPEDTLYILGDVIDRHPDGIRILRRIAGMSNARMLLGNHEYMMLRALNEPYDSFDVGRCDLEACLRVWYHNGGGVTHRYLKHIRKSVREEIVSYLRALPLSMEVTAGGRHWRLVHGAPPEWYEAYADRFRNPTHFAVWKRWETGEPMPEGDTVIFGHTPTQRYQPDMPMRIYFGPGRVGIDCGSGYSECPDDPESACGRLACLRLEDGKAFYSDEPKHTQMGET